MSTKPAFTRRQFLGTMTVVSTAVTIPAFLDRSAWAMGPAAGTQPASLGNRPGIPDDRILLVVQLTGGNDGLNAIPPFGSAEYQRARPVIGVKEKDSIKLGNNMGIGLHPDFTDLKAMIDEGNAAVVQGVGYPNPNRSHFSSMDIWHTADPSGRSAKGLGWIGRGLDQIRASHNGQIDATACVCIGDESPLAAQGKIVKPIAFQRANLFRWTGSDLHPALAAEYNKINRAGVIGDISPTQNAESQAAFVMRTALDAQVASDRIRNAVDKGTVTGFPGGRLADQLKMVAAMIRAGMPTRVYYVTLGSFDTHANQPGTQGRLLRDFASGMRAFYKELAALGQESRVLTLAFSEFGRRVEQNASNGTDHGTAGPVFLFGNMVRAAPGGLLGDHPSLAANKLDHGDVIYNVDFRNLYAAVLDGWMKADSKLVLGAPFQPAHILKT